LGGTRWHRGGNGSPAKRLLLGGRYSGPVISLRNSVFIGHSSIKVTFDLYGHLMPGTEAEAAALLDGFLGS